MVIIVAGLIRHGLGMAGIDTVLCSTVAGFGLGAFVVTPWIVTNYAYDMKPIMLTLIDGGYAIVGCTIIGLVLGLF